MPKSDLLPAGQTYVCYPGDTFTLVHTWPTSIAGRTFTAALDGEAVDADVSGSSLNVAFVAPDTTGTYVLLVTETTGTDRPVFRHLIQSRASTGSRSGELEFSVTDGTSAVTLLPIDGDVTGQVEAALDGLLEPGLGIGVRTRETEGVDRRDRVAYLGNVKTAGISSVAVETTLLDSVITIPANLLSGTGEGDYTSIEFYASGTMSNTAGSGSQTIALKLLAGNGNFWSETITLTNGTTAGWEISGRIRAFDFFGVAWAGMMRVTVDNQTPQITLKAGSGSAVVIADAQTFDLRATPSLSSSSVTCTAVFFEARIAQAI